MSIKSSSALRYANMLADEEDIEVVSGQVVLVFSCVRSIRKAIFKIGSSTCPSDTLRYILLDTVYSFFSIYT